MNVKRFWTTKIIRWLFSVVWFALAVNSVQAKLVSDDLTSASVYTQPLFVSDTDDPAELDLSEYTQIKIQGVSNPIQASVASTAERNAQININNRYATVTLQGFDGNGITATSDSDCCAIISITANQIVIDGKPSGCYGVIATGGERWIFDQSTFEQLQQKLASERTNISLEGEEINIRYTENAKNAALAAYSGGLIELQGKRIIIDWASGSGSAIEAGCAASIRISGTQLTRIIGNVTFVVPTMNSVPYFDAQVDLKLSGHNSFWRGTAIMRIGKANTYNLSNTAVKHLTVNLANGAQWIPIQYQLHPKLLKDNGVEYWGKKVEFEKDDNSRIPISHLNLDNGVVVINPGVEAGAQELTGRGTVHMDSQNPGRFTAADSNNAQITVTVNGNADSVTAEQMKKVMDRVEVAHKTGIVQEGMYQGEMIMEDSGKLSIKANTVMSGVSNLASAAPLAINRVLMNDVRKRLGNLRSTHEPSGVWVRYDGGRMAGADHLRSTFHTAQLGADRLFSTTDLRLGVAAGYTHANSTMQRGDAKMNSYNLALYATKVQESGLFTDLIGRMADAHTDVTIDRNKTGTIKNLSMSLSGETGWHFILGKTGRYYLEPQVEATYTHVSGDELKLSSGAHYQFDATDSLIGRAGLAAGLSKLRNLGDVYVKASLVHEFLGDASIRGGSIIHKTKGRESWVEYGLGANLNLNQNSYLYADFERTSGASLEEKWRATVGVRYSF